MTPAQQKILQNAPKFRHYYVAGKKAKHLIPDTPKARKWALAQGATHFSVFSLYRIEPNGIPAPHKWGDFYCLMTVSDGYGANHISRLLGLVETICHRRLKVFDLSFLKLTYLGENQLGISIPSKFFGMEQGAPFLDSYYSAFADQLRQWAGEFDDRVSIGYDHRVDAENRPLSGGRYAVPIIWNDAASMSDYDLIQAARAPRSTPPVTCLRGIEAEVNSALKTVVHRRQAERQKTKKPRKTDWVPLTPLFDETGASTCGPAHSDLAVKCAVKLNAWLLRNGIEEFRQHDLVKAFDGSFKVDVVSEAIRILMAHAHIRECPFPIYDYPGRRPSSWYVVNPATFDCLRRN